MLNNRKNCSEDRSEVDSKEIWVHEDFRVEGMTCAVCAGKVEKTLQKVPNVRSVQVNLTTEFATIDYDASKTSFSDFQDVIKKAGYALFEVSEETQKMGGIHQKRKLRQQKIELLIAGVFGLLLMGVAMGHMVGLPLPAFLNPLTAPDAFTLTQLGLLLPVLFFGRNFYLHGVRTLFQGNPNMDSLIAIGTGAATVYSIWHTVLIFSGEVNLVFQLYYETASMIIVLVMLGKYLEARSKGKTSSAIEKLIQLQPKTVIRIEGDTQKTVSIEAVIKGDLLLAKPGERIAVDGNVISGTSYVDESMLTGESMPIHKTKGSQVTAGSVNQNGSLHYTAEKIGKETTLAKIIKLVEAAQGNKAPIARIADIISGYFVPVVILIAFLSASAWLISGATISFSLKIFIAVLVIACPCALGLATPTAIMVGTGKGASMGVLIKGGEPLETAGKVSTVIFDKTGTLTKGKPTVSDISPAEGVSKEDLIQLAASAEQYSEHPIAKAILSKAKSLNLSLLKGDCFKAIPGYGIHIQISGQSLWVGNMKLMEEKGILWEEPSMLTSLAVQAKTPIFIGQKDQFLGMVAVSDPIKADSREAVDRLKKMGLYTVMLTGDNQQTADAIRHKVKVDESIAQVLPEEKANVVKSYQDRGEIVAMVGDGINDAPALAQADLGIAVGSGTDIAIESAQVILMKNGLIDVVNAIQLSRKTLLNIKENLFWALFYNAIGIPVAAGLLFIFGGPTLNPMFGAAAMAFSSISVVTNALRLRFFTPVSTEPELQNVQNFKGEDNKMKTRLKIEGMSCQHCVRNATEALSGIQGVTSVEINLENKMASVESTIALSEEMICEVINKAGYQVTSFGDR